MTDVVTPPSGTDLKRAAGVAQLLEQVTRRMTEKRDGDDLHAAQWSALRFFARAGKQAATVSNLAKYLGNTGGTSSRTTKSLLDRGLIAGDPSPHDARVISYRLTDAGTAQLQRDPLNEVATILSSLSADDLAQLADTLDKLQQALLTRRGQM